MPSCGQNNFGVAQHHKQSSQKIKQREKMVGGHSLCTGEGVSGGGGGDTEGRKGITDYDSRLRLFMPATLTHSTPITEIR